MGKIRTVKPELFRHEPLFEAEKKYQLPLRLAFIALFSCCDREGRFRWQPRSLKLDILPYDDDIDFSKILNAFLAEGFIKKYTDQGKFYGYVPSWHLHQSINKHEPPSRLPDPRQCEHVVDSQEQCIEMHMQHSALHEEPSAKSIPTSAIDRSSLASATSTTDQSKNISLNQQHNEKTTDLHTPIPEMHMHARATHMPAPEMHMHASLEMEVEMEVEEELEVEQELEVELEMEKEQEGKLGSNRNIVAPARRRPMVDAAQIFQVFNFWKTTFQHPEAVLDIKRQKLIRQALQSGYTVAQLCDAISGCAKTPHNIGDNERGQRYDGLHIILRDSDQIERFMRNHHNPPRPPNAADKLIRANASAGKNWLNKKLSEEKPDAK